MSIDQYSYRVIWSDEDQEYVGLCAEFPSLSWLEPTEAEALAGIRRVVAECVADLIEDGEPVPTPIAGKATK
jgi:predicted RNase H-like HicB family nuclease